MSAPIDGSTAAPEVHSRVVEAAAAAAAASTSVSSDTPTTDEMTLESFLLQLDLGGYLSAFEDDGYDKLEDVVEMANDEIIGIKGMKKGHAKRIIKAIAQMRKEVRTCTTDN